MDPSNSPFIGVLGLSGICFPPKLALPVRGLLLPRNTHSSGEAHSSSQTAFRSVQPFLRGSQMLCYTMHSQWGRKPPKLPLCLGIFRQSAGGGPSHGHRQHAKKLWRPIVARWSSGVFASYTVDGVGPVVQCPLARAMNGRILRCGTISPYRSAITCEIVIKRAGPVIV